MDINYQGKKLSELITIELRAALKKRGLVSSGLKSILVEKLKQALISEGKDPQTYVFERENNQKILENMTEKKDNTSIIELETSDILEVAGLNTNIDESAVNNITDKVIETTNNDDDDDVKENLIDTSDNNQHDDDVVIKEEPVDLKQEIGEENIIISDEKEAEEEATQVENTENDEDVVMKEEPQVEDTKKLRKYKPKFKRGSICNLKLTNLPLNTKSQDLKKLLLSYGAVLEVKVFHDSSKKYCYGFAKMSTSNPDRLIETLNTGKFKEFKDKQIKVTKLIINKRTIEHAKTSSSNEGDESKSKNETKLQKSNRNLWVSNLLQSTKAQELQTFLSKYAKVLGVRIVKNSSGLSKTCYGYVTLDSKSSVDFCVKTLNNTKFRGRVIRLSATKSATKENKDTLSQLDKESNKSSSVKIKKSPVVKEKDDKLKKDSPNDSKESTKVKTSDEHERAKEDNTSKKTESKRQRSRSPKRSTSASLREKIRYMQWQQQLDKQQLRRDSNKVRLELERIMEQRRRQRDEIKLLEREREKLRKERELLEKKHADFIYFEKERQRKERERLEKTREEFRKLQQFMEETQRAAKNSNSTSCVSSRRLNEDRDYNMAGTSRNDEAKVVKDAKSYKTFEYAKQPRTNEFPDDKCPSDEFSNFDNYPKRDYSSKRADDYPKRRLPDHGKRPDKKKEYPSYKRSENRFSKHTNTPNNINTDSNYFNVSSLTSVLNSPMSPDHHSKSSRQNPRKNSAVSPSSKDSKNTGHHLDIVNTEAYRSIQRENRDNRNRNLKNDIRVPLIAQVPQVNSWPVSTTTMKNFEEIDENFNSDRDQWHKSWDNTWQEPKYNMHASHFRPVCPPPPGISSYPPHNSFGNYPKKY